MTPDEQQKLDELYDWMQREKSRRDVASLRPGMSTLTQTYTDSHGDTVVAPKAYSGTEILTVNGRAREIPFL